MRSVNSRRPLGLKVDFWDLVVSQVNFGKSVAEKTDLVFF